MMSSNREHRRNQRRPTYARAALLASSVLALSVASQAVSTAAPGPSKPGAPIVATQGVGHAHGRGATPVLDGLVNPNGASTMYYFQYGLSTAYGSQTATGSLAAGTTRFRVGLVAPGILPGEHFRLVATNSFGTTTGKDRTYAGKKKKSGFELPKTSTVVYGSTLIVTGTLPGPGNAGRSLVLQATPFPYHTTFLNVAAPVVTNAKGAFVFRVAHLTTSYEIRVSTLDPRPLFSTAEVVRVAVRVTLKVRSRGPKGLVRLYGTISPAEVGARVFLQLRKPTRGNGGKSEKTTRFITQFSTTAKRATKTVSRFSAVLTITRQGRYQAYVLVKRGPIISGASPSIVLNAVAASPVGKKAHHRRKRK